MVRHGATTPAHATIQRFLPPQTPIAPSGLPNLWRTGKPRRGREGERERGWGNNSQWKASSMWASSSCARGKSNHQLTGMRGSLIPASPPLSPTAVCIPRPTVGNLSRVPGLFFVMGYRTHLQDPTYICTPRVPLPSFATCRCKLLMMVAGQGGGPSSTPITARPRPHTGKPNC